MHERPETLGGLGPPAYSRPIGTPTSSRAAPAASPPSAWTPGPAKPRLTEGDLHIWRADLERIGDEVGEHLCDLEEERARRMTSAHKGMLWRRSRGMLRMLLGSYLDLPPAQLRLICGAHDKPALASGAPLSFNLSHSRRFAVLAICHGGEVGVDVEAAHELRVDVIRLAERAFGRAEAARIETLDRASRGREFMRVWTRQEAELKRRGTGRGAPAAMPLAKSWIHEIELGSELTGAVACERAARKLRCWEWPPSGAVRTSP